MNIYVYIYVYAYTYICIYIYIYMYIHMYICIDGDIYVYIFYNIYWHDPLHFWLVTLHAMYNWCLQWLFLLFGIHPLVSCLIAVLLIYSVSCVNFCTFIPNFRKYSLLFGGHPVSSCLIVVPDLFCFMCYFL